MSQDFYEVIDQRIFMVHEDSYGKPYDPESALSAWTALAADYPHFRRVDVIPDGADPVRPIQQKLKFYDIGDSKHPSLIANGNIEPVSFTIDTIAQTLELLSYAIGQATTSHVRAMVQKITCVDESGNISQGDYFLIDGIDSSGDVKHFAVWMDTAGDGSTGKPTITGINASNVLAANLSGSTPNSTASQVASAITTVLNAQSEFSVSSNNEVITVTNANNGAVLPARNGASSPNFTYSIDTWGVSSHSISEYTGYNLESFTMHFEQRNSNKETTIQMKTL